MGSSFYNDLQDEYLYIHQHWYNIGKAIEPKKPIKDILTKDWYTSKKNIVKMQTQQDYYELFMKQPGHKELFYGLKKTSHQGREQLLNRIDNGIKQSIEAQIDHAIAHTFYDFGVELNNDIQNLIQAYQGDETKTQVEALNKIIDTIIVGLALTEETNGLAEILAEVYRNNNGGNKIDEIENKLKDPKIKSISNDNVEKAIQHIQDFFKLIKESNLTKDGLNSLLSKNLFSKVLGEVVAFQGAAFANDTIKKEWSGVASYIGSGYHSKIVGKSDIKLKNLQISLKTQNQALNATKLTVGISEKFYLSQGWKNNGLKPITIESGSGGRLGPTLAILFNQNERYYARNVLAHASKANTLMPIEDGDVPLNEDKNIIETTNTYIYSLIAARQILRIFSTTVMGEDIKNNNVVDFSGYLYANGHLISVRKIMHYVLDLLDQDNIKRSSSGINSYGITFSIPEQSKLNPSALDVSPLTRSMRNSLNINYATIIAKLHIDKLSKNILK